MATTIGRTTWTNDTGTPASPVGDGTIINNARLQDIYAAIDAVLAGAVLVGGVLGSEGFGTHLFSATGTGGNLLTVRNPTAGTNNHASHDAGNDTSAQALRCLATASTFTPSGVLTADAGHVYSTVAGGLSVGASNASGALRFYTGNALRITVGSTGVVALASGTLMDCGFLAYNSAGDSAVASGSAVDFDTEVYDEGGNFSADTFTAPATGRYLLSASVMIQNSFGATINSGARIVCSNHPSGFFIGYASIADTLQLSVSGAVVVDMDAGDTATVQYYSDTGAADIRGDGTLRLTWFCGRRVL